MVKNEIKKLSYKGYKGQYQFIKEDQCFHGKLIGISDLVTFDGANIVEVEKSFKDSVDDYIQLRDELDK